MLAMEAILIAKDMGVLLVCNLLQSQDASIQTNVSESRVILGGLPSLGSLERILEVMIQEVIPLMPRSSGLGWATVIVMVVWYDFRSTLSLFRQVQLFIHTR